MEPTTLFSHLEKEGVILLKSNGFTLIEVMIASSILMLVVTTFVPIFSLLNKERSILHDRRGVTSHLHDELQHVLWEGSKNIPSQFTADIQNKEITFYFSKESEFIKGCASWKNVKKTDETICLYGYPSR